MSDLEDIEDVFEGWLERPTESEGAKNKNWLKKSFTKKWKKGYFVLRKYSSGDQPFIQWFDKEDSWRHQMPRGTLELFPRYKVFKRAENKTKQNVFEVRTDAEMLILAAESETIMDLWVVQLQMQCVLNPRMGGEVFRLKGSGSRQMQRIGARDQRCLLHISKWGLTLALERTRAVLSQWPLTTIRSYESLDCNELIFEAGRASPMGEGKYNFFTQNSDDNKIFDVIDRLASARLRRRPADRPASTDLTEDDIERAYDQLRFSLMPSLGSSVNRGGAARSMSPSAPRSMPIETMEARGGYDHIGRSDSIGSAHSLGNFSITTESAFSYNHIERLPSWSSQTSNLPQIQEGYNRINPAPPVSPVPPVSSVVEGSYDRLARSPSIQSYSAQSVDMRVRQDRRCPLNQSQDNQRLSGGPVTPTTPKDFGSDPFDELTDSGEYKTKSPPDLPSTPTSEVAPQGSKTTERCFSRRESLMSKVGSPNFTYLNAAYSSSIEVLPVLYATVDLSKKTRNKKLAERASDTELVSSSRRRSKSSDSLLCGSPTFTHFAAFAAGQDAMSLCSVDSLAPMIPPQKPQTERVSIALTTSVEEPNMAEGVAQRVNAPALPAKKGSYRYTGQVEALERTLSEIPHVSRENKGVKLNSL